MTSSLSTVSYIGATILFILCLGGLSNQETSRRGNLYGMIGMAIAVLATVFGPQVTAGRPARTSSARWSSARRSASTRRASCKMTQMPELVALMHSLVGLAAMLVGYANFIDPAVSVEPDAGREHDPRDRDVPRRADRRGDVLRLGDRLRQALRQDQRQAGAAAGRATGSTSPASSSSSTSATRSSTRTAWPRR